MIFILKRGRFGNYLFQFFIAKIIQSYNNSKIITVSKKDNIYSFSSVKKIESIVSDYNFFPYINIFIKLIIFFGFKVTDKNIHLINNATFFKKKKLLIIDGFFQDYSIIKKKIFLLKRILNENYKFDLNVFKKADLTIHIRHLHTEYGSLDKNSRYLSQPKINFYKKIIKKLNPGTIKIISSKKNNMFYKIKKYFPKKKIFYESYDDLKDFYNLINSSNLIISNSTFSYWAALFSKAKKIFVPKLGIFDRKSKLIFKNKKFFFIK